MKKFSYIELFAGIGGFSKAIEEFGGEAVFISEMDKFAKQTFLVNFPQYLKLFHGDITKINEKNIPPHDLLVGGFPCQAFSVAGLKKGFQDATRGTLFFDIARIIKEKQPKVVILENVKGLVNHDKGKTFKTILRVLQEELHYKVFYKVINASKLVPQKRQRVFIVAFKDQGIEFNFKYFDFKDLPDIKLKSILHSKENQLINCKYSKNGQPLEKYTISDNLWNYLRERKKLMKSKGYGFGFGLHTANDVAATISARYYKDGAEILIDQGASKNPRKLTPRECARLQGFPDDFVIPVSDNQSYKQFGNALAVPVVSLIMKELMELNCL